MQNLPLVVTYVIDDDKLHHFGMQRIFRYMKMPTNVFQFYDGLQAIQYIRAHINQLSNLPDLIFLDVNMPVMNGWQFLDEFIKLMPAKNRNTTIYMVTSSVNDIDVAKAASYTQITEYVIKPVTLEQVRDLFRAYTNLQNQL